MTTQSRRPLWLHGRASPGCSTGSALPALSASTASGLRKLTCSGHCASFRFHCLRHPREMGAIEINHVLPHRSLDAIRTVEDLLGHEDVSTTMIKTHGLNRGGRGVKSSLDG